MNVLEKKPHPTYTCNRLLSILSCIVLGAYLGAICSGCILPRKTVSYEPDCQTEISDPSSQRGEDIYSPARRRKIIRSLGPHEGYVYVIFEPGVNADRNVTHDTLFGALLQAKEEYATKGLQAEQVCIAPVGLYVNHIAQLMMSMPPLSFCRAQESFQDLYGFAMEFTIRPRNSWEKVQQDWTTYEPAVVGAGSAVTVSALETMIPFGSVFFLSKSILCELERQQWLQFAREGKAPMPDKTGIEVQFSKSMDSMRQLWTMLTVPDGMDAKEQKLPEIYVIDNLRIRPHFGKNRSEQMTKK